VEVNEPASTWSSEPVSHYGILFSLYSPDTDCTKNISSIIACSLAARETTCSQSCFPATAVMLSPVYTAVTWQCFYVSHYLLQRHICRTRGVESKFFGNLVLFGTTERNWTNATVALKLSVQINLLLLKKLLFGKVVCSLCLNGHACTYTSLALCFTFRISGFCTRQVTSKLARYFMYRRIQR
jgi:hypothetical protein